MSHENTPSVTRRSLLRLLVLLVGICVFVGLVGIVVGWVGTYIVPVVVIAAVIIYIVALGLGVAERWPGSSDYNDGNDFEKWYRRF